MAVSTDTLAIVSCADSGELHVLRLSADGQPQTVQVLAPGGQLMPMALSPDQRHLHVARRSDPLAVITLALDAAAGRLHTVGEAALPASMASLNTDRSGRWLFSASYGADMVAVQGLDANGLAGAATTTYPTGRHAHCVLADPTNRFVLATSLGGGQLHRYGFDALTGRLQAMDEPVFAMPAGTGPRHLCFNPRGDRVYVLGELDACVHVLSFNPSSGALALLQTLPTLPGGVASAWGADLHLSPDGRWLYSSERNSHTLAGHAVDAHTGLLTPIGHWATEETPRGFAITADGRHLLAAGQTSHHISVHAIDPHSGALAVRARHAVGQNPNWVVALPLRGPLAG